MPDDSKIEGCYIFEDGRFRADAGMQKINMQLRQMKLLADTGPGIPSFYFDPSSGTYWQCDEFENYRKRLKVVTRDFVQKDFPTVDCDKLLDVTRPGPGED